MDVNKLDELAERVERLTAQTGCRAMPFGEFYAATDHGEIWSCRRGAWKKLSPTLSEKGYLRLTLIVNGKRMDFRVNRVVTEAFHGPAPSKAHVARHLDDNRSDNRPNNLAWGSHSENAKDAVRNGRCSGPSNSRASRHKRAADLSPARKLSSDSVRDIRRRLADGDGGSALAREYGVSKYTVSLIKKGKIWATI